MNNLLKKCSACGIEKELSEYYSDKRASDGKRTECKTCFNIRTQNYRATSFARQRLKELRKRPEAKRKVKEYNAKPESRERIKKYQATDHAKQLRVKRQNTPEFKQKCKEYDQKRRLNGYYEQPHIKKNRDIYFAKQDVVNLRNKRRKNKRESDPKFKLRCNISSSIWQSLKRNKASKSNCTWEKLVGYSLKQLKQHLEKQFTGGMSWNNYGEWHIDHKLPVVFFNFSNPFQTEFKRCWALSNLQPMWALENKKKNAKIFEEYIK